MPKLASFWNLQHNQFSSFLLVIAAVQAYDGKEAWQIDPFQGRKDPERLAPDEVKTLVLGADLDTPLVDYRAKGHSVEYLGLEDVEGSPAHKLRVTLKSGDEVTYFIDPDSMMVIRAVEKQLVRGHIRGHGFAVQHEGHRASCRGGAHAAVSPLLVSMARAMASATSVSTSVRRNDCDARWSDGGSTTLAMSAAT